MIAAPDTAQPLREKRRGRPRGSVILRAFDDDTRSRRSAYNHHARAAAFVALVDNGIVTRAALLGPRGLLVDGTVVLPAVVLDALGVLFHAQGETDDTRAIAHDCFDRYRNDERAHAIAHWVRHVAALLRGGNA